MRRLFSKIRDLLGRNKMITAVLAVFLLLLIVMLAGSGGYLFLVHPASTSQPAMLKAVSGTTELQRSPGSTWELVPDMGVELEGGESVRVSEESLAVIQYHGGGVSLLTGPAEVQFSRFEEESRGILDPKTYIDLDVYSGKVTTDLGLDRSSEDKVYVELRAPGSAAVFQDEIFEMDVAGDGATSWTLIKGSAKVAVLASDNSDDEIAALISLSDVQNLEVPPLPQEWNIEYPLEVDGFVDILADIAQTASEQDDSDVSVEGASQLAGPDSVTGTALFSLSGVGDLPPATMADADPDPERDLVEDGILSDQVPSLAVTYAPVIRYTSIPYLPFPDGWITVPAAQSARESSPHYVSSIMDVPKPFGVTIDMDMDRIYVTEHGWDSETSEGRATTIFDLDGNIIGELIPPDVQDNRLVHSPQRVAVNRLGNIYISDLTRQCIDIYSGSTGEHLGYFYPDPDDVDERWLPVGMTFDKVGNLYVTDRSSSASLLYDHRVIVLDSAGDVVVTFGDEDWEGADFKFPTDIVVDSRGWVYVSQRNQAIGAKIFSIQSNVGAVYPYGECERKMEFVIPGAMASICGGIAIGPDGCLYLADPNGDTVKRFDTQNGMSPLLPFDDLALDDGAMNGPEGISIDSDGRIYIADSYNDRIMIWSY